MNRLRKWSEEDLIRELPKCYNFTELLDNLGLCRTGGSRGTLKNILKT